MVPPLPEGPLSQLKLMLSPWSCGKANEGMLKPKTKSYCENTHSEPFQVSVVLAQTHILAWNSWVPLSPLL